MKRIGHRIFLLLSSVRVKRLVNATGCLFVRQENESRVFCPSPTGSIVSIGSADEKLRPFKFCAKIWSAPGRWGKTFFLSEKNYLIVSLKSHSGDRLKFASTFLSHVPDIFPNLKMSRDTRRMPLEQNFLQYRGENGKTQALGSVFQH